MSYVRFDMACSLPNSTTPMSAGRIRAQDRRVAAVASCFESGNRALTGLVNALAGRSGPATRRPADQLLGAGSGGVGTDGTGVWPVGGRVFDSGWPSMVWGGPYPNLNLTAASDQIGYPCSALPGTGQPVVIVPPVITPVRPAPALSPVMAVKASASADPASCSSAPADICRSLRDGCYLASQVSPAQLLACARAGWSGNRNLFPAVLARGGAEGGRFLGSVNLDPPRPDGLGAVEDLNPGLDVLTGGAGSRVLWGSLGLLAFAFFAANTLSKKGRRTYRR